MLNYSILLHTNIEQMPLFSCITPEEIDMLHELLYNLLESNSRGISSPADFACQSREQVMGLLVLHVIGHLAGMPHRYIDYPLCPAITDLNGFMMSGSELGYYTGELSKLCESWPKAKFVDSTKLITDPDDLVKGIKDHPSLQMDTYKEKKRVCQRLSH